MIPLRQALTNDSSPAEVPQGSFLHWGVDILHEAAYNKGRTIRCLSTRIKDENPRGSDPLGFSIPNYVLCLCPPQQRQQALEERLVGAGDRIRLRAVQRGLHQLRLAVDAGAVDLLAQVRPTRL